MNDARQRCDADALRRLLDEDLPADDEAAVVRHLDGCGKCRELLEGFAAGPLQWASLRGLSDGGQPRSAASSDGLPDPGVTRAAVLSRSQMPPHADDFRRPDPADLSFLAPTDDPAMAGRVGPYEVVGVVGRGGAGLVLKAFDRSLNRFVAVKVLSPALAESAAARARFAREARAAAAVVHEHVIPIHAVAEHAGLPYLVMPYLPGGSLQRRLDAAGPLGVAETLRVGMQAALGLAAAHAQGVVHRDVKPANLLLEQGVERVVIADFGLARVTDDADLTRSGVISGTPQFMSPEQARGEAVDHRSDLFSLGSVLYAALAGRPPFRAETTFGVLRRITDDVPRPLREVAPQTPDWLCDVVARLHEKRPADRFGSAAEVAGLLGRWLAHVQQPLAVPPPARTGRRHGAWRAVTRRAAAFAEARAFASALLLAGFYAAALLVVVAVLGSLPKGATRDRIESASPLPALRDEQAVDAELEEMSLRASRVGSEWRGGPDTPDPRPAVTAGLGREIDELARDLRSESSADGENDRIE